MGDRKGGKLNDDCPGRRLWEKRLDVLVVEVVVESELSYPILLQIY